MDDEKKRNFNRRMEALHEKYHRQLPDKYYEIENCWNEYQTDLNNAEVCKTFYRLIHTLKGTAATFGFVKQAEFCFAIQKILMNIEEGAVLSEHSTRQIQQQLDELKINITTPAQNIAD